MQSASVSIDNEGLRVVGDVTFAGDVSLATAPIVAAAGAPTATALVTREYVDSAISTLSASQASALSTSVVSAADLAAAPTSGDIIIPAGVCFYPMRATVVIYPLVGETRGVTAPAGSMDLRLGSVAGTGEELLVRSLATSTVFMPTSWYDAAISDCVGTAGRGLVGTIRLACTNYSASFRIRAVVTGVALAI